MERDSYISFGGVVVFSIFVCDGVTSFFNLSVDVPFVVVTSNALDGIYAFSSCFYHTYSLVDIVA